MSKQKQLHNEVISLEFKGRMVRCREIDNKIFIPITDIANIVNAINIWDKYEGVYSTCSSMERIIFYKDNTIMWAIEPMDIVKLCRLGHKKSLPQISLELIEWGKNIRKTLNEKRKFDNAQPKSELGGTIGLSNKGWVLAAPEEATTQICTNKTKIEIIKIEEKDGQQAVSARELHSFLESKKDFSSWMKDRIERYGFIENQDYCLLTEIGEQKGRGGHNKIEYILTVDVAKELSMVEGNEKGRQARRYFIECEKKIGMIHSIPKSYPEALQLAADQAKKIEEQFKIIKEQTPLANLGEAVMKYDDDITINELSKLLCQNGISTGEHRLRSTLKEKGFLMRDGMPTQKSVEGGWMIIVKGICDDPDNGEALYKKAMVTVKGQNYFVNKFLNNK